MATSSTPTEALRGSLITILDKSLPPFIAEEELARSIALADAVDELLESFTLQAGGVAGSFPPQAKS